MTIARWTTSLFIACSLHCGTSNATGSDTPSLPYFTEVIYSSQSAIDQKFAQFQTAVEQQLNAVIDFSKKERFADAYQEWSGLCNRLFTLKLQLRWTAGLATEESVKQYAEAQSLRLVESFSEQLKKRSDLARAFAGNAMAASSLTPMQRYITRGVLNDYLKLQKPDSSLAKQITASLSHLGQYEEAPFDFVEKKTAQNTPPVGDELKVFSANIICFPEKLAYLHGGISYWGNRILPLTQKSKDTGAQILFFQEVWDPEAMRALVEHLKDQYAFFVYDAGDQFATIDARAIGNSSGLFVASQIPLDTIAFTPFANVYPAVGGARRGGLLMTCTVQGQKVSFVNTHLQHGYDATAGQYRKEQILTCYQMLQKAIQNANGPSWGFLAGDINVNAFSPEFKESGLQTLFSIPYLKDQTAITTENSTATNYFLDLVMTPLDKRNAVVPDKELLDYCMCPADLNKQYITQKIPLYSLTDPENALSDHHGILTTWKLMIQSLSRQD